MIDQIQSSALGPNAYAFNPSLWQIGLVVAVLLVALVAVMREVLETGVLKTIGLALLQVGIGTVVLYAGAQIWFYFYA